MNPHGQIGDASDKTRSQSFWRSNDLNLFKAFHDFFPDNPKLHLSKAIAHAAVNPKPKSEVVASVASINDEPIRLIDHVLIAIALDVPHEQLIVFMDMPASQFDVLVCGAPHIGQGRLPTNNL